MKKRLLYSLLTMGFMAPTILNSITLQTDKSIHSVVLAAGEGSRFKTGITKLIAPICGQPLVVYTCSLMEKLGYPTTAVIGYQKEKVKAAIDNAHLKNMYFAEQKQQLGTGHALAASKDTWQAQNILVLNGDMPLITQDIIGKVADEHFKNNAAITIVTSYNIDPANAFGRIVNIGNKIKIVEKKHFTHDIKEYPYVNVGVYLINRSFLDTYLSSIKQNEKTNEFYITDLVEIASEHNLPVHTIALPFDPFYGVNTFQELAQVEQITHDNLIKYWNDRGVRFISPQTITIDYNVKIGKGTVIHAGAQLINGTQIGEFCTINSGAVLDNSLLGNTVSIGANAVLHNSSIETNRIVAPLTHIGSPFVLPGTISQLLQAK